MSSETILRTQPRVGRVSDRPWRLLVVVAALVAIAGCEVPGSTTTTSNPKASVEILFDVDGYRIYRFRDGERPIYFVLPARGERTASIEWQSSCGKACTRTNQVITLERP